VLMPLNTLSCGALCQNSCASPVTASATQNDRL
jgi:hypothetical protein